MFNLLKNQIAHVLSKHLQKPLSEIEQLLEKPKNKDHGHLAFPVFLLSKERRQAPPLVAQSLAQDLNGKVPHVEQINPIGGFLNFVFSVEILQSTLFEALKQGERLGFSKDGEKKKVIIDFSSPNIAKPMHIGHLRGTVIGQVLKNLAGSQGYEVIGVNHIGDWGSQFGKLAWALKTWGAEYDFKTTPMQRLLELYVRFHDEAKKNPEIEKKGAETFKKLEQGDSEIKYLWKQVIDYSFADYNKLYQLLNIHHDVVLGESFYNDKLDDVVHRLEAKNLLKSSEGAQVVFFEEKDNMPPCLIKKSDGASIYATRDLAAALYRKEVQKGDLFLYVVGQEQALHLKQVFKVLEMMGLEWAKDCHHVSFGLYKFKDGKMSTREGRVILLEDVIKQAIDLTRELIERKNPQLQDKDLVSSQVAIGALIFNDLVNDRTKNVEFDWERVLSMDGDSGPYVQYSYVRCRSLLRKFNKPVDWQSIPSFSAPEEAKLVFTLLQLEDVLRGSFQNLRPHILAQYLLEVCSDFSHFYHKCRILGEAKEVENSRMSLVFATERVLYQGLRMLNIAAPENM